MCELSLAILLSKHARCVAEMTMNSASANRELHTFGEWRTDHDAYARVLATECDNLEKQMEALEEEEKLTLVGPTHQDGVPDENPPLAEALVTFYPLVLHNLPDAALKNKAFLSVMHSLRSATLIPEHSNRLIREILNVTQGGNPGWNFSPPAALDNKLESKESHEQAPDRGGSKNNNTPESPKER